MGDRGGLKDTAPTLHDPERSPPQGLSIMSLPESVVKAIRKFHKTVERSGSPGGRRSDTLRWRMISSLPEIDIVTFNRPITGTSQGVSEDPRQDQCLAKGPKSDCLTHS